MKSENMRIKSYPSFFSAVNKRFETFATSAGTMYGSNLCAACNAILKFSMAASRKASKATWADFVIPTGFNGISMTGIFSSELIPWTI